MEQRIAEGKKRGRPKGYSPIKKEAKLDKVIAIRVRSEDYEQIQTLSTLGQSAAILIRRGLQLAIQEARAS